MIGTEGVTSSLGGSIPYPEPWKDEFVLMVWQASGAHVRSYNVVLQIGSTNKLAMRYHSRQIAA